MITVDAREAHEVGSCQACGEFKSAMLVAIKFQPQFRSLGYTLFLCYACTQLLRRVLGGDRVR